MGMNLRELDILKNLSLSPFVSQRVLAESLGCALETVNRSLQILISKGYLVRTDKDREKVVLADKAKSFLQSNSPKNAIILAAGYGMRMVPINMERPKGLLKIKKETLIERIIKQLHENGINEIHIVVGFMKEKFEYLIDKYHVDLIVNPEYAKRNNLESLACAAKYLKNSYIIPSDVWCQENPFNKVEVYPWYMVSDLLDEDSNIRVNRKRELLLVNSGTKGNKMIGISYLCGDICDIVRKRIYKYHENPGYMDKFWEETLYTDNKMIVFANVVDRRRCVEINTYEQLRDLDGDSNQLKSVAISTIADVFHCRETDITEISVLKKGMTNRSFLFNVKNVKTPGLSDGQYIMRVPGEGTDLLINRRQEVNVYEAIKDKGLCDAPVYINYANGFKITRYLQNVRVCNPFNEVDQRRCMSKLRKLHSQRIQVKHAFDIFKNIRFYHSLWDDKKSMYWDHEKTTNQVFSLKRYIDSQQRDFCLTHIDAVYDNFLFYVENGREQLQLTDWEYAGMQDPHVDIAMFCIYAMYDKAQTDHLIDIYFQGQCSDDIRTKIYCYMAACGLLWSNWCEYKSQLGVEFGEYSLQQYRYAKDYYRYAKERIE